LPSGLAIFERDLESAGHILEPNDSRAARILTQEERVRLAGYRCIAAALEVFAPRLKIAAKRPLPLLSIVVGADDLQLPIAPTSCPGNMAMDIAVPPFDVLLDWELTQVFGHRKPGPKTVTVRNGGVGPGQSKSQQQDAGDQKGKEPPDYHSHPGYSHSDFHTASTHRPDWAFRPARHDK